MANNPLTPVQPTQGEVNKEQGIVIQNLVIRPVVRRELDVERWRGALRAAEGLVPQRVELYDLYDDVLLDSFLNSLIEKRILGVTKRKLQFVDKEGKEVEDMTKIIGTQQFRLLRREIMLQKFWGISVIELDKTDDGGIKIFSVPRKHIHSWAGIISFEQFGTEGIPYQAEPYTKYVFQVGRSNDLGLILKAAPYVLYKRGGLADYAHYSEIFGSPFRLAKYDGFNQHVRQQIEQALELSGGMGYAVVPNESTLEFIESKNAASNGELYNTFRQACNEELSVLILGQTETTTSSKSSGYAQAAVHQDVLDALNQSDGEEELSVFNEIVKPILANLGFPMNDGEFVHVEETEDVGLVDKANMFTVLKEQLKLPLSDDFLYREFGIPKPENYNELKEQQQQQQAASQALQQQNSEAKEEDNNEQKQPKKQTANAKQKNLSAWDRLRSRMIDFFDQAPLD